MTRNDRQVSEWESTIIGGGFNVEEIFHFIFISFLSSRLNSENFLSLSLYNPKQNSSEKLPAHDENLFEKNNKRRAMKRRGWGVFLHESSFAAKCNEIMFLYHSRAGKNREIELEKKNVFALKLARIEILLCDDGGCLATLWRIFVAFLLKIDEVQPLFICIIICLSIHHKKTIIDFIQQPTFHCFGFILRSGMSSSSSQPSATKEEKENNFQ